jgi:hypothetical protein
MCTRGYRMDAGGARYGKNARAVFSLKYLVVWCPKYWRPTRVVETRLIELMLQSTAVRGMKVHAL